MTEPVLREVDPAAVKLLSSRFQQAANVNRAYLMELKNENLLQNHYFEAGIWGPPGKPLDDIHWGWESPNSLVRGHFLGHWMSAAARLAYVNGDKELCARVEVIVSELARCQEENGGEWVASIPEKYLERAARGRMTWACQYIVSKTLMGLLEAHKWLGNEQALDVLGKQADWFHRWTMKFSREEMDNLIDFETCGMLEAWAELYGITKNQRDLDLMERYDRRRLFDRLVAGEDALTNRHANSTIPEVLGAARAYEVTGEQRWRDVVEAYWHFAVEARESFVTGGQTSGEIWTPPGRIAVRLSDKNQEHCTVYNMMRLAEYLLRWTGDAKYADYRERNHYNGILAQQHRTTGMLTYFLPLAPGSKKTWGGKTDSFWCCYGTLVQAHTVHDAGVFYEDDAGLVVEGYVPAEVKWSRLGQDVAVTLAEGLPGKLPAEGAVDLDRPVGVERPSAAQYWLRVAVEQPAEFTVRLRVPWWVSGAPLIDGEAVAVSGQYIEMKRTWTGETTLRIDLPRTLTWEPLPDRPDTGAFMEGPVVLAGLCDHERTLFVGEDDGDPTSILQLDGERQWDHWMAHYHATGQDIGLRFMPLHDVTDEKYTVYFPVRSRS